MKGPITLAIDIGGTGIKMMLLDGQGKPITKYFRTPTPHPAEFVQVYNCIERMMKNHIHLPFDRVSVGFPGVILKGIVMTAFNLHPSWININFQQVLEEMTKCPVRVANDADVQGLGDISRQGLEMVITLGTGFGSSLFIDGKLVPNLQLAHHPFRDGKTYEDFLGNDALKKYGVAVWNEYLKEALVLIKNTFNYDRLYIGGGNARNIRFNLPGNVKISSNIEGVLGGFYLWE